MILAQVAMVGGQAMHAADVQCRNMAFFFCDKIDDNLTWWASGILSCLGLEVSVRAGLHGAYGYGARHGAVGLEEVGRSATLRVAQF
jgi:hypothetical protein